MRARELRDVIEVLIVPSLYGALVELTKKKGSRRKARLLVKQALDQLRLSMAPPTAESADIAGAAVGANHEFVEKPEGPMRCGRCGSLDGSPSAALPCSKGPLD